MLNDKDSRELLMLSGVLLLYTVTVPYSTNACFSES
jgi:hypothetical protein